MNIIRNPPRDSWANLLQRPEPDNENIALVVTNILSRVREAGDSALKDFCEKFDHWAPDSFLVSESEMLGAADKVPAVLKKAIDVARDNIERFHRAQQEPVTKIETSAGIACWRQSVAIERVGLYIPGGTASLFSSLLMLGVPAQIAGCREIVVCSPAPGGRVDPTLLYVASLVGVTQFFKIGGAQAIAAMAYGTASVPQVHKIFGPGNRYVTLAKQMVNGEGVSIDMPAGPSEVAVFADGSSRPAFVAADLLSQAEHGPDSQVLLVTTSEKIARQVMEEIISQKAQLGRQTAMDGALAGSKCIVMPDVTASFDLLNEYAPEHLIIASDDALSLSELVIHAGSVFLGHYSPESAGDYISGTNHTLPTNGYAKAYSGVSLDSFVRKITFQQLTAAGLQGVSAEIAAMADAEGLPAHKNAVVKRIEAL